MAGILSLSLMTVYLKENKKMMTLEQPKTLAQAGQLERSIK